MKKRVWIFAALLLLLLPLICVPVTASKAVGPLISDKDGLLTAADRKALAAQFASYEDIRFAVLLRHDQTVYLNSSDGYPRMDSMKAVGDDFLLSNGVSLKEDTALLIITLYRGTYYYHLCLYGAPDERISQKESDYILDHEDVYNNIKGGNLTAGIEAFQTLTVTAHEGRLGASYGIIVTVSACIAVVIGIIACVGVKMKYSMKHRSVDYPLDRFAKLNLTEQSDVFTGSFVTKRIIQTSSGSRSGGRGGGGGGSCRGGR